MQINEPSLSHSSALSFGPEWMRPKPSKTDIKGAWGNESPQNSKTLYSTDELLQVWSALQQKLQTPGFEEKYSSLEPIRELVSQVERDTQLQSTKKPQNVEQLTEKLNEIDSWAKKEGNGLDFASILNNVANSKQQQQQQQQQQQSPFTSIHQNSSFSNLNSPLAAPHGLHAFSQQHPLLQPDQINWYYVDPNGKEQGPFNGLEMQNWYNLNYLSPDLQIRREGEFSFTLLREFATRVGDTIQPFLVSLQSLKPLAPVPQQQFNPFDQQIPGLFDQSFVQPQVSQFQPSANAWNLGNSGRNSPWTQPVQPVHGLGNDYMNNLYTQQDDELFNHIQNQMLDDVLTKSPVIPVVSSVERKESVPEPVQTSIQEPIPESIQEPIPVSIPVIPEPTAKPKTKAPIQKTDKKSKPIKITTTAEAKSESKSAPPAPWASHASYTTPQMTLEQIQQLEGQEKLRQQKLRAEKAAQMLASTEKSLREQELLNVKQQALPSTSSWATSNAIDAPTKTLADIQREEAETAAKQAKQAKQASMAQPVITPSKSSFASIASTTSAWTVVTSKKPQQVQQQQQQQPVIHSTLKQATPDMLRSVSATTTQTYVTTSTKTVSPRQEFLTWCRTTLKLNKGVSVNDVLQIMLMLPVTQESSEIIADTVYSNSSTMDGRRFAQEFMKRRRGVEAVVNDGLSWNDALHISITDDDDGWDFQVVKKKGKKRN